MLGAAQRASGLPRSARCGYSAELPLGEASPRGRETGRKPLCIIVSFKCKYKADTEGSQCSEKQEIEPTARLSVAVAGMCARANTCMCAWCVYVWLCVLMCVGLHVSVRV